MIVVVEPEVNGQPVCGVMEVVRVTIAMGQVVHYATILGFAVIVTEQVKNGMNAGHVMEQVNATTVTGKDGKHALIVTEKAEKLALNVAETVW